MNKLIYILMIGGILMGNAGCRKYVEIPPEQSKVLSTTTDYQQLLYNYNTIEQSYFYPLYSGDEITSEEAVWQNTLNPTMTNVHTWNEKFVSSTEEDPDWSETYKRIFIYNTVIDGVMGSTGSDAEKQAAMASALVHRAYDYYTLVNSYAKQYDAATAATDPGVPLVLQPKFLTDLTRASIAQVYDLVVADINQALPALPNLPDFSPNPSKAAAYAILARVYLNKREFTEAKRYAELSLGLKSALLDLNLYKAAPTTLPNKVLNPEELFFKRTRSGSNSFPLSADAESMFDKVNDLRYTIFTGAGPSVPGSNTLNTRVYMRFRLAGDGTYVGPSVPEMMLIKAECEARANNPSGAATVLNELRKKRFNNTVPYVDVAPASGDVALRMVIDERKREFLGRGFRWFDLRRLNKDAGFVNTVTRVFKGTTYKLEPNSNRYTFAIGDKYIDFNPEIIQNPR
jgi:tetratricopeptide (TPR) repeat protein